MIFKKQSLGKLPILNKIEKLFLIFYLNHSRYFRTSYQVLIELTRINRIRACQKQIHLAGQLPKHINYFMLDENSKDFRKYRLKRCLLIFSFIKIFQSIYYFYHVDSKPKKKNFKSFNLTPKFQYMRVFNYNRAGQDHFQL